MLIAVDSNVLLRQIVRDDEAQLSTVRKIFRSSKILLVPLVLAETEWVLRSVYGWMRSDINDALQALLDHENVSTTDDPRIRRALAHHADGADLADMLLHAEAHLAERLVTFDADFVKRAHGFVDPTVERLQP